MSRQAGDYVDAAVAAGSRRSSTRAPDGEPEAAFGVERQAVGQPAGNVGEAQAGAPSAPVSGAVSNASAPPP